MPFLFDELLRQIKGDADRIAAATGQDAAFLKAIALAVGLGVQSSGGASSPAATGAVATRSASTLETDWAVGTIVTPNVPNALPQFVLSSASGRPVVVQPSVIASYQGAAVLLPSSGQRTSIRAISTSGGTTTLTLADLVPISKGEPFIVYIRPPGVDATGAVRALAGSNYSGTLSLSVPAGSAQAVLGTSQFRPVDLVVEVHRGVLQVVSQQGYTYTVTAQLFMAQTDPDGDVAVTPQGEAVATLPPIPGTNPPVLPFGMPPTLCNTVTFSLTPSQAQPETDVVVLRWALDASSFGIDQAPGGLSPIYIGGITAGGAVEPFGAAQGQSGLYDLPTTLDGATIQQPTDIQSSLQTALFSTTTPLAANATFTGASVFVATMRRLIGSAYSDQSGTAYLEQSPDGTNWDVSSSYAVTGGTGLGIEADVVAPYGRGAYTNGATAQTVLRLYGWGVPVR